MMVFIHWHQSVLYTEILLKYKSVHFSKPSSGFPHLNKSSKYQWATKPYTCLAPCQPSLHLLPFSLLLLIPQTHLPCCALKMPSTSCLRAVVPTTPSVCPTLISVYSLGLSLDVRQWHQQYKSLCLMFKKSRGRHSRDNITRTHFPFILLLCHMWLSFSKSSHGLWSKIATGYHVWFPANRKEEEGKSVLFLWNVG